MGARSKIARRVGSARAPVAPVLHHYSARPQVLKPLADWMTLYGALWRDRFDCLEDLLNRMDQ